VVSKVLSLLTKNVQRLTPEDDYKGTQLTCFTSTKNRMLTAEELVKDGYLQITDRAKDLIKTGGEWISSIDLENIALQALTLLALLVLY
jgi:acyl-CoA synthetase (AMP-forming)/AMP-acid ligase II